VACVVFIAGKPARLRRQSDVDAREGDVELHNTVHCRCIPLPCADISAAPGPWVGALQFHGCHHAAAPSKAGDARVNNVVQRPHTGNDTDGSVHSTVYTQQATHRKPVDGVVEALRHVQAVVLAARNT
jgi:hypothetical protein